MKKLLSSKLVVVVSLLVFSSVIVWVIIPEERIDYNTHVKPILNKHCISCHGGVKQSGGFSLLFEEEAKGNTDSGQPAIIPGHSRDSEMIRRLTSEDPEERMPYEKAPLSKEEIEILKKWIDQGAEWETHWSYVPVEPIEVENDLENDEAYSSWGKNEIDYFIYEKVQELGLQPAPRADENVLKRRLSLDIIGLPVEAAVPQGENMGDGYNLDTFIDILLESPHFGEKWAGMWMDLARYADTKGYERDAARTIWKYRDWLIKAFNEDKPYDQFLIEQIAGDLLPNPTDDQFIATAFHRNTMTNDEGGTDNEEFRVAAVVDRVNTTWEVTMGTTFACVQCHSHPYDPFTLENYYEFLAFFNNTRDEDTFDEYPVFRHLEDKDSVKLNELSAWLEDHATPDRKDEIITFLKTWQPSINSLTSDQFVNSELADTKWLVFRNHGSSRLKNVNLDDKNTLIFRYRTLTPGGTWKISLDSINGHLIKEIKIGDTDRRWAFDELRFEQVTGTHDIYFSYSNPALKDPRSNGLMFDWFYFTSEFPQKNTEGYQQARSVFWQLLKARTLKTPIMMENPDAMERETRIFERGNWLSPGDLVEAGVPEVMNPLPETSEPDRLRMALWLTSEQNPLTARTYVNRIWEQLFGAGIVETLEDMGSQGIPPTNQKLLDHLAWKFMHEFGWSTKALVKYIVSSATYQQSSKNTEEKLALDPQNKYCSRGPRIRLTAEQVRDQALVVSGLFNPEMYGPSVKPYQPEGIWNSPYNGEKWKKSEGEDQYRRALYTYWKRTSPYPSMLIFDAMAREVCTSRRISTNTPLQALVTLNDSAYVEAAYHFAQRMMQEGGMDVADQIGYGYEVMMNQKISSEKLDVLLDLYEKINDEGMIRKAAYRANDSVWSKHKKAMIVVANTMLNLDEFLMKN
jgi:hypothetical protein